MKNGYDNFFKQAQKNAGISHGPTSISKPKDKGVKFSLTEQAARQAGKKVVTPEDRLRQELASRVRRKKETAIRRKKQSFPVFPAICVVAAIAVGSVGYFNPDLADQALSSLQIPGIKIGFLGKAAAADKKDDKKSEKKEDKKKDEKSPAKDAAVNGETQANAADPAQGEKPQVPSDFRQWSDEEISFFNKLNDRKKELDLREAELAKLDEELQKQKAELDAKIKQLETMRGEISKTLKTRVANDQEKVDKLVQFYSTMKPQQAAKIIESLNEDLAVEVVDKMKKKSAAEIMNMMDAKKARRLSELLTGYQRTPASKGLGEAGSESGGDSAESSAQAPSESEEE